MNHALSEPVSHVFVKAWVNQHAEKRPNFYHNMHIPKSYPKTSILTNHSHRLNQTAPKNFHFFHNWNFGYCFFWNFYRTWETEGYSNKRIFDSSPHRYISFSFSLAYLAWVHPRSAVDSVHSEEFAWGNVPSLQGYMKPKDYQPHWKYLWIIRDHEMSYRFATVLRGYVIYFPNNELVVSKRRFWSK